MTKLEELKAALDAAYDAYAENYYSDTYAETYAAYGDALDAYEEELEKQNELAN